MAHQVLNHPSEPPRQSGRALQRWLRRGGLDFAGRGAELDALNRSLLDPDRAGAQPHRRLERYRSVALSVSNLSALTAALAALSAFPILLLHAPSVIAAAAAIFVFARVTELDSRDSLVLHRSTLDEAPQLLELSVLATAAYWLALPSPIGRSPLVALLVVLLVVVVVMRWAARWSLRRLAGPDRCLFLGDVAALDVVRRKLDGGSPDAVLVGAISLEHTATAADIGGVEGLQQVVGEVDATRVILSPVSLSIADTHELIRVAKEAHVQISILPRLLEVVGTAVEFEELEGLTLMGIRRFGLSRRARGIKRTLDVVSSCIGLIAAAPLLAIISLAIKLDSSGPVLFRQRRVGRDGQHFDILKFRSMVDGAEAQRAALLSQNETVGLFKLSSDPRVTRIGRLMRKTSLDELPQLLNVLRGEMSLVGPRPLVLDEDAQITGLVRRRLHLTPGMTGPWQIMRSGRVPMDEMVSIDYAYASTWSLWGDLKLLLRTALYVANRGGV